LSADTAVAAQQLQEAIAQASEQLEQLTRRDAERAPQ
jgi:hypothetical protein